MIEDKEIQALIKAGGYKEPSDKFTDRVMYKINAEKISREKQIIRPWFWGMMGFIFSGALLSAFFLNPGKENDSEPFFFMLNIKLNHILSSVSSLIAGFPVHWLTLSIVFTVMAVLAVLALEVHDAAGYA